MDTSGIPWSTYPHRSKAECINPTNIKTFKLYHTIYVYQATHKLFEINLLKPGSELSLIKRPEFMMKTWALSLMHFYQQSSFPSVPHFLYKLVYSF